VKIRDLNVSQRTSSCTQALQGKGRQDSISSQVTPMTCPPDSFAPRETASIVPE